MRKRWKDEPSGDGSDDAKGVLMAELTIEDAFALGLRPGERPDGLRMERAFRAGCGPIRNPRSTPPIRLPRRIATPPDRPARRLRPSRR